MRVGYDNLTRPKEQAWDWVWSVDHTVQRGAEKSLVILGLRLAALPPPGTWLRHEHGEPLALSPVQKSTGAGVSQPLVPAVAQPGVPREILSAGGADVQAGVEQFRQTHPDTRALSDIKHKTAVVLKPELAEDPTGQAFTPQAAQTKHRVQQTPRALLAPPPQRRKARSLTVDILIRWGGHLLRSLEQRPRVGPAEVAPEQRAEPEGWSTGFREQLQVWGELRQRGEAVERFVRTQGR